MKKRLEAELISIAHRILKLKNKSEVDQLYKETQKLYETLSILKFYGDNFETVKAEIPVEVLEEKLAKNLEDKKTTSIELETPVVAVIREVVVPETPEVAPKKEAVTALLDQEIVDEVAETTQEEPIFKPAFELASAEELEVTAEEMVPEVKSETKQISFEDFLGENYADPVFVKPNEVSLPASSLFSIPKSETSLENSAPKIVAVNETSNKNIPIGLNDRVAFVKNLFGDSNEDYNRVLSQLSTFDTFEEAKSFINEMVIPDYNYWIGKEEYIERFMEIVANKFE